MPKRIKPKMGDALVVNYTELDNPAARTCFVIAECECRQATYTAEHGASADLPEARKASGRVSAAGRANP